jgi:epoxyqueuosine reductase
MIAIPARNPSRSIAAVNDGMSLTDQVKAQALHLGFQLVGVTSPDPPPHYTVYEAWLGSGHHGEMGYLASEPARQRRADPRRILPECQSILVLGMRYPAPELVTPPISSGNYGRVSSYAWGDDYHEVIVERLKGLVAYIEEQVGSAVANRWYTDTGPILERDLAQRAGLGWIGKNTCLINPRMGSYFFLAEILLGIELEMDAPFVADRCGSCTRCIDACPTNCILPNRTMDASRCISYLTIELKGAIPPNLRPFVGDWVFGCDVCQQVCPWNQRFGPLEGDPAFSPQPGVPFPDFLEDIRLTPEDFNRKFKGSSVKRTKRRGYLRNVAVALGNLVADQGAEISAEAVTALSKVLQDEPEPLVRAHAAWELGRIGGERARNALIMAAQRERDEQVRSEIQAALAD